MSGANPAQDSAKRGLMDDTLDELLKEHKFSSKKDEPKTLGDMRKKQLEEEMDPDKLKVKSASGSLFSKCYFCNTGKCMHL